MSAGGTAAVFTTDFVPYSQTFVYDEIRAHDRYSIDVFSKRRMNEGDFPEGRVRCPRSRAGRAFYESVGFWPPHDRVLARREHDLIHAHFGTGAVYALPYVRRHDYPFIVTFWGNDVGSLLGSQRRLPGRWRYVRAAPRIMERADLMLCVSETLRRHIAELSGREEATRLYRPGVDVSRFAPRERPADVVEFILVGRFTEKKGHEFAIRAFARIARHGGGHRARLALVGSGRLEDRMRTLVRELGIEKSVVFRGRLSHADTAGAMARAHVALAPSVVARDHDLEGSPTVLREAAACGLPAVGTIHSGIPEIIEDGRTGYVVPERDVDALADRMLDLLENADRRESFGRAARRKMEAEFDLYGRVAALEEIYDSVRRG